MCRQLQDGSGARLEGGPERGHRLDPADLAPVTVDEDDVDREPHAERVDAAAARDQQPGPGAIAAQQRQAEEPGTEAARDRHDDATGAETAETAKAARPGVHRPVDPAAPPDAPAKVP